MLTLVLWQHVVFLCVSRALFRMSLVIVVRRILFRMSTAVDVLFMPYSVRLTHNTRHATTAPN